MSDVNWYALVQNGIVVAKISVEPGFFENLDISQKVEITGYQDSVDTGYLYSNGVFTPPTI